MINQAVLDNMKARRSCRAFSQDMPAKELIAAICEAGTWAPTGHGKQSPVIVAVTDKSLRDRLSAMNAKIWNQLKVQRGETPLEGFDPFYGAPVVLVVLADRKVPTYFHDGCAVLANMANAAEAVGLGSCWIHRAKEEFDSEEGKTLLKELGIEGDYEGIDHLVVGYAAKPAAPPLPRKKDYIRWA